MLRKNFPGRKDKKRSEGQVRDAAFKAMPLEERLARNSVKYQERELQKYRLVEGNYVKK